MGQFPRSYTGLGGCWERKCHCSQKALATGAGYFPVLGFSAKHPLSPFPPCVVTRVIVSQDLVGTLKLGHTHIRSLISFLGTSPTSQPERWSEGGGVWGSTGCGSGLSCYDLIKGRSSCWWRNPLVHSPFGSALPEFIFQGLGLTASRCHNWDELRGGGGHSIVRSTRRDYRNPQLKVSNRVLPRYQAVSLA